MNGTLVLYVRETQDALCLFHAASVDPEAAIKEFLDRGWFGTRVVGYMPHGDLDKLHKGYPFLKASAEPVSRYEISFSRDRYNDEGNVLLNG